MDRLRPFKLTGCGPASRICAQNAIKALINHFHSTQKRMKKHHFDLEVLVHMGQFLRAISRRIFYFTGYEHGRIAQDYQH